MAKKATKKAAKKTVKKVKRDPSRAKLLKVIETMPDEAFSWLLINMVNYIWPRGMGGFTPQSRTSIDQARKQASILLEKLS